MEPCVEVNRDDFMQYLEYYYWRQFCKVTGKVYRTPWSIAIINQSINHLFVSDQWSISKNIEIMKRRNKSNKSNSTQYSLENSIAKKPHTQKACEHIHLKSWKETNGALLRCPSLFSWSYFNPSVGIPLLSVRFSQCDALEMGAWLTRRNTSLPHVSPCKTGSFLVKQYDRNHRHPRENSLTPRVPPFKMTRGHRNQRRSIGYLWLSISDPL